MEDAESQDFDDGFDIDDDDKIESRTSDGCGDNELDDLAAEIEEYFKQTEEEAAGDLKPFREPTKEYKSSQMLTGVLIHKMSLFSSTILGRKGMMEVMLADAAKDSDEFVPERTVLSRAVAMAYQCIGNGRVSIRDGKASMKEYQAASTYEAPESQMKLNCWARRLESNMYGATYIGPYKGRVKELFIKGSETSSEKWGQGR